VTRRHWGAVILVVWAASLAWLVKREYFRPTGARLAEAALAVSPGAFYYHIGSHGRQVGFASTTVDTLIDSIRVEDLLVLDEAALGRVHRSSARSTAVLTRALRLRSVETDIDADGRSFAARGIFGQGIFIDPKRKLVIASNANWGAGATDRVASAAREAFYRAVQNAVDDEAAGQPGSR